MKARTPIMIVGMSIPWILLFFIIFFSTGAASL
jgi:hypothetical protein